MLDGGTVNVTPFGLCAIIITIKSKNYKIILQKKTKTKKQKKTKQNKKTKQKKQKKKKKPL
jgi:hypothetical protein